MIHFSFHFAVQGVALDPFNDVVQDYRMDWDSMPNVIGGWGSSVPGQTSALPGQYKPYTPPLFPSRPCSVGGA